MSGVQKVLHTTQLDAASRQMRYVAFVFLAVTEPSDAHFARPGRVKLLEPNLRIAGSGRLTYRSNTPEEAS